MKQDSLIEFSKEEGISRLDTHEDFKKVILQEIIEKKLYEENKLYSVILENLYQERKITVNKEAEQTFSDCLINLKEQEVENFIDAYLDTVHRNFISNVQKSATYQEAKELIQNIIPSVAYAVDITIKEGILISINSLEIRHSSKQHRHITPVAVIKRIINNALLIGKPVGQSIKAIEAIVEIFYPNITVEDNNYIQGVFEYYKNPANQNENGLKQLIKFVAQFYNELLCIALEDSWVKMPKTKDHYLLPRLEHVGKKRIHNSEGSLVAGFIVILDDFEKKIAKSQNKSLSNTELAQLCYSIFAIFDYLPLLSNAKKYKGKPDPCKHRYIGEGMGRLFALCLRHLTFIFEAYSSITKFYAYEIMDKFIYYIANGVSSNDLFEIFHVQDILELSTLLDTKKESIEIDECFINSHLVNDEQKANCGFAKQYDLKPDEFVAQLEHFLLPRLKELTDILEDKYDDLQEDITEDNKLIKRINFFIVNLLYSVYDDENSLKELVNMAQNVGLDLDNFFDTKKFFPVYQGKFTEFIWQEFCTENTNNNNMNISKIVKNILTRNDRREMSQLNRTIRKIIYETYFSLEKIIDNDLDYLQTSYNQLKILLNNIAKESLNISQSSNTTSSSDENYTMNSISETTSTPSVDYSQNQEAKLALYSSPINRIYHVAGEIPPSSSKISSYFKRHMPRNQNMTPIPMSKGSSSGSDKELELSFEDINKYESTDEETKFTIPNPRSRSSSTES